MVMIAILATSSLTALADQKKAGIDECNKYTGLAGGYDCQCLAEAFFPLTNGFIYDPKTSSPCLSKEKLKTQIKAVKCEQTGRVAKFSLKKDLDCECYAEKYAKEIMGARSPSGMWSSIDISVKIMRQCAK